MGRSSTPVVGRGRLIAIAFLGNAVPIGAATATDWSSHRLVFFIGAIGSCIVSVLVTACPPPLARTRRLISFSGIPMLVCMTAYTGGVASGYCVLMMMAMVWFGAEAEDLDVIALVVLLALCAVVPMLAFGAPAFPVSWGHAFLLVFSGATVAGTIRYAVRETIRLTNRLRDEAQRDPLTGLLNRRGWDQSVQAELARGRRDSRLPALVMIDLDAFKQLNDTRGHDEGDRALQALAAGLDATLRGGDFSARLGGDEFVALLANATPDGALSAVNRLRERVPSSVAFSAGIALMERHETLDDLVRRADIALYSAKTQGANSIRFADRALEAGAGPRR